MIARKDIPNESDIALINIFSYLEDSILHKHNTADNSEALTGFGNYCVITLQYVVLTLTKLIAIRNTEMGYEKLSEYYDFPNLKRKLSCYGFSLENLLKSAGVSKPDAKEGISTMEINKSFIVGEKYEKPIYKTYDINSLDKECGLILNGERLPLIVSENILFLTKEDNTLLI